MLDRAVREMKGEAAAEEAETQLNLGLNIRIPSDYIKEENQRLRMYKRIAGVETETQLRDVASELEDRYGAPPSAVRNLLEYATLKLLASRVGVTAIERKREVVTIKFQQNAVIDTSKLAHFVSSQAGAQFTPDGMLRFNLKAVSPSEVLNHLKNLLQQLAPEMPEPATSENRL
jgi:transcription-repair coupling factor (superfamily II helicase)